MLGRDHEIETVDALLRRAADGHGGGVVLHGEPGIGKSALLSHAEERATGFQVLRAVGHHQHRLGIRPKWLRAAAVVLIALLVPGTVSAVNTIGKFGDLYVPRADAVSVAPAPKPHDPAKPTVAFVVSASGTQAADLLGSYELLASTGRFNTYVVAPGSGIAPLTSGLDLVPDFTFDGLNRLLDSRHDRLDALVIPALRDPDPAELTAITGWVRQQHATGALAVSVCNGARTLAETGLLDGRPATSHWVRLSSLRDDYTAVHWETGLRYVDDGDVITTAGVLSGIDGGLRIIERLSDVDTARTAALALHWRHYSPGVAARIPASGWEISDAVVALNSSYAAGPSKIGVQLSDGVDELALAALFTSYTEQAMVARTIAIGDGPVRSRHGLTFVPRSASAAGLDRLLVPGPGVAASDGPRPEYLPGDGEFAFDPVLRDIARTYDVQTARWTAKSLEYPVLDVELTGDAWPWGPTVIPVLLALLGAAASIGAAMAFRRFRSRTMDRPGAPQPDVPVLAGR